MSLCYSVWYGSPKIYLLFQFPSVCGIKISDVVDTEYTSVLMCVVGVLASFWTKQTLCVNCNPSNWQPDHSLFDHFFPSLTTQVKKYIQYCIFHGVYSTFNNEKNHGVTLFQVLINCVRTYVLAQYSVHLTYGGLSRKSTAS